MAAWHRGTRATAAPAARVLGGRGTEATIRRHRRSKALVDGGVRRRRRGTAWTWSRCWPGFPPRPGGSWTSCCPGREASGCSTWSGTTDAAVILLTTAGRGRRSACGPGQRARDDYVIKPFPAGPSSWSAGAAPCCAGGGRVPPPSSTATWSSTNSRALPAGPARWLELDRHRAAVAGATWREQRGPGPVTKNQNPDAGVGYERYDPKHRSGACQRAAPGSWRAGGPDRAHRARPRYKLGPREPGSPRGRHSSLRLGGVTVVGDRGRAAAVGPASARRRPGP